MKGRLTFLVLGTVSLVVVLSLLFRKGKSMKDVAFLAAWLVPGAGHFVLGKWKKGLFFFLLLGATYAFGMVITGWRPVSFDDNPFYFVGQYGSGATLLIAKLRGAEKAIVQNGIHPSWFDPGLLYVCVVGLLNLVVMLNVLDETAKPIVDPGVAPPGQAPAMDKTAAPAAPAPAPVPAPEKPA